MKTTILWMLIWLLFGIANFLIYSEAFGNVNKDSYLWQLNVIFSFCMFIIAGVKFELERWKKK